MAIQIREYTAADIPQMLEIWNDIVEEGIAFPQTESLTVESAEQFFAAQSRTSVAEYRGQIVGLYILHPNNIGRCGHLANASYAVRPQTRDLHIGEQLVKHSMQIARQLGFKVLQFNAVVATNHRAIHLYEKLGFVRLGMVPQGFRLKNGAYEDIILFYHQL